MHNILNDHKKYPIIINNSDIFDISKERISLSNNSRSVLIPNLCSNRDIFTSSFNKDIENTYPEVKDNYHLLGSPFLKKNLGYTQFININTKHSYQNKNKIIFANMIAQDDFKPSKKRTINYGALAICMYKIKNYILANSDDQTIIEIHTPKFGSGVANWVFIQELIEDIWCKHFLVFIHNTHNSHIKHS